MPSSPNQSQPDDAAPSPEDTSASETPSPEASPPVDEASQRGVRSWTRPIERGLAYGFAALTITAVLLLAALQLEPVSTATARFLASTLNPLEGTTLRIDRATGTWVTSLQLTGVRLTRTDSTTGEVLEMASVDTLYARYQLGELVNQTLNITRATIAGPSVTLRQAADSTWDWQRVLPTSTDTTTSSFVVKLRDATLRRGRAEARFFQKQHSTDRAGTDSIATVQDLEIVLPELVSDASLGGLGLRARLDTLGVQAGIPGDTATVRLGTRFRLDPSALRLDTLMLSSARSQVRGHGLARIPTGDGDTLEDVDLEIVAAPLSFLDLLPLLPTAGLNPDETVRARVQLRGSGNQLRSQLTADVQEGGEADIDATFTPRTSSDGSEQPLRYDVSARIDQLTTSLIGPPDSTVNRLTASLRASLEGPTVQSLSGPVSARVENTRFATIEVDSLLVDGRLQNGRADHTLRGLVNGAGIDGRIEGRLLDDMPTYRLTAAVANLDAERFGAEGFPTNVNGEVRMDGRGATSETHRASTQITLQSSRFRDLVVDSARADLTLTPDSVRGRLGLTSDSGALNLAGAASLDGRERFRVDTARVQNVNVAALLADTTDSRLNADLTARGRGFSPEQMRLDARLDITDTYYGTIRVDSLRSTATLDAGALTARLGTQINDGTIAMTVSGEPLRDNLAVDVTDGRFSGIDIGKWIGGGTYSSDLHGTFRGTVRGANREQMRASGAVRLDTSRVNRETISAATLRARLDRGTADVRLNLTLPDGTSRLAARARPFADVPEFTITDGQLSGIDAGALANIDGLDTHLSGRLRGEGRGTGAEDLTGSLTLALRDSRLNRAELPRATFSVNADSGRTTLTLRSRVAGGTLQADGQLDARQHLQTAGAASADSTTLGLNVRASSLDLAALAGSDSTDAALDSLRWTFDGAGTSLETLSAQTTLAARGLTAADFRISDVDVAGQLREGQLRIDTLLARSNAVNLTGGGTVAYRGGDADDGGPELGASDFRFSARSVRLSSLRRLAGARTLDADSARIDGRIYGTPGRLRFNLEGVLASLAYDDIRVASADIRASGRQGDTTAVETFQMVGLVSYFSVSNLRVEETRMEVRYDSSLADVELTSTIDDTRSIELGAQVDPFSTPRRLTLSTFNATLDESRWQLLQEASVTYGDAYRVNGLLLYSDNQQIAADGRIDPNGTQSLVATIESFEVSSIADLAGYGGLGGALNGTISLSGDASAPQLSGDLDMALRSGGRDVGDLDLSLTYDSLRLRTDATLTHVDGPTLTAGGTLPVNLRLNSDQTVDVSSDPVDLSINASAFPADWIDPFLDAALVRDPAGRLSADLDIGGTLATPEVNGSASFTDGRATVTDLEVRYRDAEANLTFSGDQVRLERLAVYDDDGGRLEGTGIIDLAELTLGRYDLELRANDFTAIDTRAFNTVRLDGLMDVTGTTEAPVVNGRLTVNQGDIYYTETLSDAESANLATVQLDENDQRLLEQRFGVRLTQADTTTFDAYKALAMDLTVNIRRDTWLRSRANPELNIQFTGTLDLQKEPNEDARVFGAIDVVPERSTVRQFGQEFQIQEGVLTFNGDPAEPYLNFTAVYEKQSRATNSTEVTITLSAQGRPEDLNLNLSSQPQMDTRNILSYLATGQPADQLLSGGGSSTGDLAENLAIGQLTSLAENFATSNVGLDVVRIQYQPNGGSYFVLGRYVTPRFYVAIEQPVAVDQNQGQNASSLAPDLTLEYELTDNLLLRAQSRQQSLRFNVLFEYAY